LRLSLCILPAHPGDSSTKPMRLPHTLAGSDDALSEQPMAYRRTIDATSYVFSDLRDLLAKATPPRSGDRLAGIAAGSAQQMIAARIALADVPLRQFLQETVIPYEDDEVTRLIVDSHDAQAFAAISSLTVGGFRDWLLSDAATSETLRQISDGVTPEMAAAVSKLMRNQDLIQVAKKCQVITQFRNSIGLRGRMSARLQPNHPFDDAKGITASILDGLLLGSGDACIGINPASDDPVVIGGLIRLLDDIIARLRIPTQSCVLTHVTTTLGLIEQGLPVDLVFQSVAGTEAANRSFGVDLALLQQAHQAGLSLRRGTVGSNVMYFETGQGSALSANAHHNVDQQTLEARAYAVARAFDPLLVNSVVGFIGPEYLYDGKEIIRAGLEDHFCGKLLGLPLGVDICYTNHAEADQDDMDNLLTLLAAAGVNFIMGVPGADDVMLNYQSTSFHDALYVRDLFGLRRAPEFDDWLIRVGLADANARLAGAAGLLPDFISRLIA
jgi:ethanolamine ammonia-lyase large subunit